LRIAGAARLAVAARRVANHRTASEQDELHRIASVQRQIDNLFVIDDRRDADGTRLHHRCVPLDLDGLRHGAQCHGDVDRARIPDVEHDTGLLEARESGHRRGDLVRADGEIGEDVLTVSACDHEPGLAGSGLRDRDRGARQHAAGFVGHRARQLGDGLSERRGREHQRHGDGEPNTTSNHTVDLIPRTAVRPPAGLHVLK
jgi:hypothetical protein